MQNYTKFQKILSFILITSILSSFTFHIQFFWFIWTLFAAEEKHYNLVSIFVQEDIYSDIKNEITINNKCGHVDFCSICMSKLNECPICRTRFDKKDVTFYEIAVRK